MEVFVKGGGEGKPMVAIEAGPRQPRATHQIQAPRKISPPQAVQVVQVEALVVGPPLDLLSRPVLEAHPAEGHGVERLLHGPPMRLFQACGSQPVVAVDEHQEPPPRPPQHLVPGRPQALVLLMNDPQPAVAGGQPVEHLPRAVGRAVVDGDDLEIVERLPEQRPNALLDPALHIIAGKADGNGNPTRRRLNKHPPTSKQLRTATPLPPPCPPPPHTGNTPILQTHPTTFHTLRAKRPPEAFPTPTPLPDTCVKPESVGAAFSPTHPRAS